MQTASVLHVRLHVQGTKYFATNRHMTETRPNIQTTANLLPTGTGKEGQTGAQKRLPTNAQPLQPIRGVITEGRTFPKASVDEDDVDGGAQALHHLDFQHGALSLGHKHELLHHEALRQFDQQLQHVWNPCEPHYHEHLQHKGQIPTAADMNNSAFTIKIAFRLPSTAVVSWADRKNGTMPKALCLIPSSKLSFLGFRI